jgi:hypothetical protein
MYLGLQVRFDPIIVKSANFACAEGLVKLEKGTSYLLTEEGSEFAQAINDQGILKDEIEFLVRNKSLFTESNITKLIGWEL